MTPDQMKELAARLRAYAWAIDSLDFDLHDENAVDIRAAADLIDSMAQRVPLTDEQIESCLPETIHTAEDGWLRTTAQTFHDFARAIEEAHGIRSDK